MFAFQGVGLQPYAPVHLSGSWDVASGDIAISWLRRTRVNGDDWEGEDVPLGEEAERYDLEILSGTTAMRAARVSTPSYLYTLAQQMADFGAQQWNLSINVYQVSPSFGRGAQAHGFIFH